jgi:hypothetical protein
MDKLTPKGWQPENVIPVGRMGDGGKSVFLLSLLPYKLVLRASCRLGRSSNSGHCQRRRFLVLSFCGFHHGHRTPCRRWRAALARNDASLS